MNDVRRWLALGSVPFLLIVCGTILFAAQSGVNVQRSTTSDLILMLSNPIASDTIRVDGSIRVRPQVHYTRLVEFNGRVQYVRSLDVIVPGPSEFDLHHAEYDSKNLSVSADMIGAVPAYLPQAPRGERVCLTYDGIASDRHIARLDVVVAEQTPSGFSVMTSARIHLKFRPSSTSTMRAASGMALNVVNPQAPWTVGLTSSSPRRQKMDGEKVQNEIPSTAYRFAITSEGLYRFSAEQLRSVGIPTDATAAKSVKIYGNGGQELSETVSMALQNTLREQPIIVETNADGSIREILFYACGSVGWRNSGDSIRHYINHYTTEAGYYLTVGGAPGLRAQPRSFAPQEPAVRPTTTTGRVFMEEELVNPFSMGSGRRWVGRTIENRSSLTLTTPLPGFVPNGTVFYRYVVGHRGKLQGTVTVSESGTTISQVNLPILPDYMDVYTSMGWGTIAAARISADGRSNLRLAYSSSDAGSTGVIDWIEVHYPQSLEAQDNTYTFWSQPGDGGVHEYAVNGFTASVYAFEVTDPSRPVLLENAANVGGMFCVREQIGKGSPRRYYISATPRNVGSLSRVTIPDVFAPERAANVIVIAHPDLLASARAFASYRQRQGVFSVSVTSIDEIYARYSYGIADPTAIRDFIAQAYDRWSDRLTHIVLWGDGHYDYKNISTRQKNFIVPYESLDPDNASIGLSTYTTDDFFVRVRGDDRRPDLAIGRVPVRSDAEGTVFTGKIKNYESSAALDDWRTRITLVADDGTKENNLSDGSTHLDQNESLATYVLPKEFQQKKIYMVEYPTENVARGRRKPSVTQELLSTVNTSGSVLLNYIGHGNPRVWAHEQIFVRETTPGDMLNVSKPFFLTAATCDFARFDMTDLQSGAEELLLKPDGGAIGVFSAARVVFSSDNARLNNEFYSDLFERLPDGTFPTLGQTMYRVKQIYSGANDEKFMIFGDPTMKLLVPDHRITFTAINGQDILADTAAVSVQALGTVDVSGFITRPGSSAVDTSFNGYVTVSLTDAARTVTVYDTDIGNSKNTFLRPGAALYKGSFRVEKGLFTASFVVPKDISFSQNLAALYGYAASADQRFAMGVTRRVIVDGVADVSDPESTGPEIQVYFDSRKFLPGGIVRPNPVLIVDLRDETGINTTGVGIGHDITAQFNNASNVEILTPSFSTSLEDARSGTAQKQIFGLGPGMHTVTVQAWDVYNNVSQKSTMFRIPDGETGIVGEGIMNFPNPFSSSTTIRFTHASQRPFAATLSIYDLHGARVVERPMQIIDMQTADLTWDGLDESGDAVQSGIYQVVVQLRDANGTTSHVSGKVTLIR